jgi:DNA modification methylase
MTNILKNKNTIGSVNPITLMQGDCLEIMKSIGDNSVDAIITDPPYG